MTSAEINYAKQLKVEPGTILSPEDERILTAIGLAREKLVPQISGTYHDEWLKELDYSTNPQIIERARRDFSKLFLTDNYSPVWDAVIKPDILEWLQQPESWLVRENYNRLKAQGRDPLSTHDRSSWFSSQIKNDNTFVSFARHQQKIRRDKLEHFEKVVQQAYKSVSQIVINAAVTHPYLTGDTVIKRMSMLTGGVYACDTMILHKYRRSILYDPKIASSYNIGAHALLINERQQDTITDVIAHEIIHALDSRFSRSVHVAEIFPNINQARHTTALTEASAILQGNHILRHHRFIRTPDEMETAMSEYKANEHTDEYNKHVRFVKDLLRVMSFKDRYTFISALYETFGFYDLTAVSANSYGLDTLLRLFQKYRDKFNISDYAFPDEDIHVVTNNDFIKQYLSPRERMLPNKMFGYHKKRGSTKTRNTISRSDTLDDAREVRVRSISTQKHILRALSIAGKYQEQKTVFENKDTNNEALNEALSETYDLIKFVGTMNFKEQILEFLTLHAAELIGENSDIPLQTVRANLKNYCIKIGAERIWATWEPSWDSKMLPLYIQNIIETAKDDKRKEGSHYQVMLQFNTLRELLSNKAVADIIQRDLDSIFKQVSIPGKGRLSRAHAAMAIIYQKYYSVIFGDLPDHVAVTHKHAFTSLFFKKLDRYKLYDSITLLFANPDYNDDFKGYQSKKEAIPSAITNAIPQHSREINPAEQSSVSRFGGDRIFGESLIGRLKLYRGDTDYQEKLLLREKEEFKGLLRTKDNPNSYILSEFRQMISNFVRSDNVKLEQLLAIYAKDFQGALPSIAMYRWAVEHNQLRLAEQCLLQEFGALRDIPLSALKMFLEYHINSQTFRQHDMSNAIKIIQPMILEHMRKFMEVNRGFMPGSTDINSLIAKQISRISVTDPWIKPDVTGSYTSSRNGKADSVLYIANSLSGTSMILSLIHEYNHHLFPGFTTNPKLNEVFISLVSELIIAASEDTLYEPKLPETFEEISALLQKNNRYSVEKGLFLASLSKIDKDKIPAVLIQMYCAFFADNKSDSKAIINSMATINTAAGFDWLTEFSNNLQMNEPSYSTYNFPSDTTSKGNTIDKHDERITYDISSTNLNITYDETSGYVRVTNSGGVAYLDHLLHLSTDYALAGGVHDYLTWLKIVHKNTPQALVVESDSINAAAMYFVQQQNTPVSLLMTIPPNLSNGTLMPDLRSLEQLQTEIPVYLQSIENLCRSKEAVMNTLTDLFSSDDIAIEDISEWMYEGTRKSINVRINNHGSLATLKFNIDNKQFSGITISDSNDDLMFQGNYTNNTLTISSAALFSQKDRVTLIKGLTSLVTQSGNTITNIINTNDLVIRGDAPDSAQSRPTNTPELIAATEPQFYTTEQLQLIGSLMASALQALGANEREISTWLQIRNIRLDAHSVKQKHTSRASESALSQEKLLEYLATNSSTILNILQSCYNQALSQDSILHITRYSARLHDMESLMDGGGNKYDNLKKWRAILKALPTDSLQVLLTSAVTDVNNAESSLLRSLLEEKIPARLSPPVDEAARTLLALIHAGTPAQGITYTPFAHVLQQLIKELGPQSTKGIPQVVAERPSKRYSNHPLGSINNAVVYKHVLGEQEGRDWHTTPSGILLPPSGGAMGHIALPQPHLQHAAEKQEDPQTIGTTIESVRGILTAVLLNADASLHITPEIGHAINELVKQIVLARGGNSISEAMLNRIIQDPTHIDGNSSIMLEHNVLSDLIAMRDGHTAFVAFLKKASSQRQLLTAELIHHAWRYASRSAEESLRTASHVMRVDSKVTHDTYKYGYVLHLALIDYLQTQSIPSKYLQFAQRYNHPEFTEIVKRVADTISPTLANLHYDKPLTTEQIFALDTIWRVVWQEIYPLHERISGEKISTAIAKATAGSHLLSTIELPYSTHSIETTFIPIVNEFQLSDHSTSQFYRAVQGMVEAYYSYPHKGFRSVWKTNQNHTVIYESPIVKEDRTQAIEIPAFGILLTVHNNSGIYTVVQGEDSPATVIQRSSSENGEILVFNYNNHKYTLILQPRDKTTQEDYITVRSAAQKIYGVLGSIYNFSTGHFLADYECARDQLQREYDSGQAYWLINRDLTVEQIRALVQNGEPINDRERGILDRDAALSKEELSLTSHTYTIDVASRLWGLLRPRQEQVTEYSNGLVVHRPHPNRRVLEAVWDTTRFSSRLALAAGAHGMRRVGTAIGDTISTVSTYNSMRQEYKRLRDITDEANQLITGSTNTRMSLWTAVHGQIVHLTGRRTQSERKVSRMEVALADSLETIQTLQEQLDNRKHRILGILAGQTPGDVNKEVERAMKTYLQLQKLSTTPPLVTVITQLATEALVSAMNAPFEVAKSALQLSEYVAMKAGNGVGGLLHVGSEVFDATMKSTGAALESIGSIGTGISIAGMEALGGMGSVVSQVFNDALDSLTLGSTPSEQASHTTSIPLPPNALLALGKLSPSQIGQVLQQGRTHTATSHTSQGRPSVIGPALVWSTAQLLSKAAWATKAIVHATKDATRLPGSLAALDGSSNMRITSKTRPAPPTIVVQPDDIVSRYASPNQSIGPRRVTIIEGQVVGPDNTVLATQILGQYETPRPSQPYSLPDTQWPWSNGGLFPTKGGDQPPTEPVVVPTTLKNGKIRQRFADGTPRSHTARQPDVYTVSNPDTGTTATYRDGRFVGGSITTPDQGTLSFGAGEEGPFNTSRIGREAQAASQRRERLTGEARSALAKVTMDIAQLVSARQGTGWNSETLARLSDLVQSRADISHWLGAPDAQGSWQTPGEIRQAYQRLGKGLQELKGSIQPLEEQLRDLRNDAKRLLE